MTLYKLALIVPHTKDAPGAKGIDLPPEYHYMIDLYALMKFPKEIESRVFYRDQVGIHGAYRQVKSWFEQSPLRACAAVECHYNAAPESVKGKAQGTEVLYCDEKDLPWVNEKYLAKTVLNDICKTLGSRSRGIKTRPQSSGEAGWYSVNQFAEYPSILPELFFGDHPEDARRAQLKDELASSLVRSLSDFLLNH